MRPVSVTLANRTVVDRRYRRTLSLVRDAARLLAVEVGLVAWKVARSGASRCLRERFV